jgi:alpha-methylacyl-CoA racemase
MSTDQTDGYVHSKPLDGLKVLDLTRMLPGAMCTLLLADLGADVVKVEAPGFGDGNRRGLEFESAHVAINRGQRSVALDLRSEGARAVLGRLVGWADVVVESHRPGQLDERGLGYEAMSAIHPHIVWCSVTGFGDFGPNAAKGGHDVTFLGYAGLLSRLSDGPTTPPSAVLAAPMAASLAAVGILSGVLEARRTGRGSRLDANMVDSTMWMLSEEFARVANDPGPGWGTMAARNVYTCADGEEVTVAATEPRSWATLCAAIDAPEIAGHRLGLDEDEPVRARLAERFATRPAADWSREPGLAGGVGPVNDIVELLDDPQVAQRSSIVPLIDSEVRVLANPIRFHSAPGDAASHALAPPPDLGADTDDVLVAIGFTADEIGTLRRDGVVS